MDSKGFDKLAKIKKIDHIRQLCELSPIEERIIWREDIKLNPYKCTAGVLTVGVGHTKDVSEPISVEEALSLLREDLNVAIKDCIKIFGNGYWYQLSDIRREALIDMCFNLGYTRFSNFKRMIRAIKEHRWNDAFVECAFNIVDGKLTPNRYHKQVKDRALIIATELLTNRRLKY